MQLNDALHREPVKKLSTYGDCLIDALCIIKEGCDERAIAMLSDQGSMRVCDREKSFSSVRHEQRAVGGRYHTVCQYSGLATSEIVVGPGYLPDRLRGIRPGCNRRRRV